MALNKYLLCARAVGTHGVGGTLRLESFTDSPKILKELTTLYVKNSEVGMTPLKVEKASVQKEAVLMKLDAVNSLEEAITWKGKELYAAREDFHLTDGAWFVADVIGLDVFDAETGEKIGTVSDVMTGRIQNIFVVNDVCGTSFMIPQVDEFVKRVTVEGDNAGVYVSLIDGMRESRDGK